MKHFSLLCLAFALASLLVNAIVYAQLADVHKNTCLIVHLRDLTKPIPSRKSIKNPSLRKVQEFLDAANIPLEISYVRAGSQHEALIDSTSVNEIILQSKPALKEPVEEVPKIEALNNNEDKIEVIDKSIIVLPKEASIEENQYAIMNKAEKSYTQYEEIVN